jgi:hypothetical protein
MRPPAMEEGIELYQKERHDEEDGVDVGEKSTEKA